MIKIASSETKELKAAKISQPNAYKSGKPENNIHIPKDQIKKCKYWGGSLTKCYRQWTDIGQIIKGKQAQCGSTEGARQGGEVQHIGGPTGTWPQPALLHLYDFNTSAFNSTDKISKIVVSFDYRVINVNSNGKVWTKNLAKSERAALNGIEAWWGKSDKSIKLSKVQTDKTQLQYEYKNKNGNYIWKTIKFTFDDISISDLLSNNFALNLQFGYNCSAAKTPCFLYIKNLKITSIYNSAKKYIEGSNNTQSLYTSTEGDCCTTITQTVKAGLKNGSKKDTSLTSHIIVSKKPNNVTVTTSGTDPKTFQIIDKSGVEGTKTITYTLDNDSKVKKEIEYKAIKRPKPEYYIVENYRYNESFDSSKSYIILKNGCAKKVKIYIDSINSTPLSFDIITNPIDETNLLNATQNHTFHDAIKSLSCGYHTLYIQRDNESLDDVKKNKVTIRVSSMQFKFKIFDENNPSMVYNQNASEGSVTSLKIQRIDNEPVEKISVSVTNNADIYQNTQTVNNVKKGDSFIYQVPITKVGQFTVKATSDNVCGAYEPSIAQFTVKSVTHKQNYDYLFTKGNNGTAFDFDYLVAWEGDSIAHPITIDDINLKHSENSIRLCSEASSANLSQIGIVTLSITNKETTDIEGIQIELNTLIEEDSNLYITTNEWISSDGIFNDFYNLFYEYNQDIIDNIEIQNLTPDNDLTDEENVYLLIKKIDSNNTIKIKLPYKSPIEKTVYLEYLIFEDKQPIYPLTNCNRPQPIGTNIKIEVIDSMQTQLEISGNTDLLTLDTTFSCPTECYTTKNDEDESQGITYKITNIDTNDFGLNELNTEIINSNEMIPYGYYLDNHYYDINANGDTGNRRIKWKRETTSEIKPLEGQLIYAYINFPSLSTETVIQRTEKNGLAKFFIPIPEELNTSYTINELLDIIYFEFKGKNDYDACILAGTENSYATPNIRDTNKSQTFLKNENNYKRYYPGQIAYIPVYLSVSLDIIRNKITFQPKLGNQGTSDEITILYKICNLENNEGTFKTTFKTNHRLLIPNEISKDIYCGIDTNIDIDTKLEKQVIESEDINVIYLNVINTKKINKDVEIEIDLGRRLNLDGSYIYPGDYSFLDINIDSGDYAITEENNNIIITWLLGEMQINQINKGIIKIKAQNIGLSDIRISSFDYLHQKGQNIKAVKQSNCSQCENPTYRAKNSQWEKIDNTWYKLINGSYYYRKLVNNQLKWVKKNG